MKKASVTANTILCAKMEIEIKYFNKRKMDFEPFLEPWILHVKFTKINEDTSIYIKNFESKQVNESFPKKTDHGFNFFIRNTVKP